MLTVAFAGVALLASACGEESPGAGVAVVDSTAPTNTDAASSSSTDGSEVTTSSEAGSSTSEETGDTDDTSSTTAEPSGPGWAGVDFNNFEYTLESGGAPITVAGGLFGRGEPGGADHLYFEVLEVGYGNIGDEPDDEAFVWITYRTGGNGQFSDVYVYGLEGGQPVLLGRAGLGDRGSAGVTEVRFDADALLVIRSEGPAACCPDRRVKTWHRVANGHLVTSSGPEEQALIFLDGTSPLPEIKFLQGGTSAFIIVDSAGGEVAFFEAGEGQQMTLTVAGAGGSGAAAAIEILDQADNRAILGVAPGRADTVTLPTSGLYTVVASDLGVVEFEIDIQ